MSETELQAWDWGVLFAILSLDLSGPFLPDIGLGVDRPEVLRSIARDYMTGWEKPNTLRKSGRETANQVLLMEALAGVDREFGAPSVETLRQLAREAAQPSIRLNVSWIVLLQDFDDHAKVAPPPVPRAKLDAFRKAFEGYLLRTDPASERLEAAAAAGPSSDWDRRLCAPGAFYPPDPPNVGFDAAPFLRRIITRAASRDLWQTIDQSLTRDDVARLAEWGQAFVPNVAVRLAHPDTG
ncbi:MAG: hypothetical protein E6J01_16690 [Chloroflexi bacterium]|nr:MAG: hypothetical protein E6J01_16690 [Chloroflexota bacterium]